MSKDKAEKLLEQSSEQKRTNTEPITADDDSSVQDGIRDAYADILDGDASSNTTVRDVNLTALLRGLDDVDELDELMERANDALGREHNDGQVSRSQTLALLARVGLQEVDPSLMSTASDARQEHEASKEYEF